MGGSLSSFSRAANVVGLVLMFLVSGVALRGPVEIVSQAAAIGDRQAEGTEAGLWYLDAVDDSAGLSADGSGFGRSLAEVPNTLVANQAAPWTRFGQGYYLSGSSRLKQVDGGFWLTGDLSITMAFRLDITGYNQTLLVHEGTSTGKQYGAVYRVNVAPSGKLQYSHQFLDLLGNPVVWWQTSSGVLTTGFHWLTLQRTAATHSVAVKIDGATWITGTYTDATRPNSGSFGDVWIGNSAAGSKPLRGKAYEVRLWNHAVTQSVLDDYAAPYSSTFVTSACVNFWDRTASPNAFLHQRWVTIEVWDYDFGAGDDLLYSVQTDDGCFTSAPIPRLDPDQAGQNQAIYVKVKLQNLWARVSDSASNPAYYFQTPYQTVGYESAHPFGELYVTDAGNVYNPSEPIVEQAQQLFQYINNGFDFATTYMQVDAITLRTPVHSLVFPADTGVVCAGAPACTDATTTWVRGDQYMPFPITHEYGHVVIYRFQNPSPLPPSYHDPVAPGCAAYPGPDSSDLTSQQSAWNEGFADWFGHYANYRLSSPNFGAPRTPGADATLTAESNTCAPGGNYASEYNVQAMLWDLVDPTVDGQDTSYEPLTHVGDVVTSCGYADTLYGFYYDAPQLPFCGWKSQGYSRCAFMKAARQNNIDLGSVPSPSLTSPVAGSWTRGLLTVAASIDSDCNDVTNLEARASGGACGSASPLLGTDTAAPWSISKDTSGFLSDGQHYVCMKATDGGGTSSWKTSSYTIGIDNAAPTATATATPPNGANGWNTASPTISATCSDATSGIASLQYALNGGSPVVVAWPYSAAVTAQGTSSFVFTCTDRAGGTATAPLSVKLDSGAPSGSISLSSEAARETSFTVSWSGADAVSGFSCYTLRYHDGSTWHPWLNCVTSTSASFSGATAGQTYTFELTVFDLAGNTATRTVTQYINRPPVANAGPDQTVLFAQNQVSGVTVNAAGSTDPDGSLTSYCFAWGDGSAQECGAPSSRNHKYSQATGTPGGPAQYVVTATVTDNVGKTAADTAVIRVPLA